MAQIEVEQLLRRAVEGPLVRPHETLLVLGLRCEVGVGVVEVQEEEERRVGFLQEILLGAGDDVAAAVLRQHPHRARILLRLGQVEAHTDSIGAEPFGACREHHVKNETVAGGRLNPAGPRGAGAVGR